MRAAILAVVSAAHGVSKRTNAPGPGSRGLRRRCWTCRLHLDVSCAGDAALRGAADRGELRRREVRDNGFAAKLQAILGRHATSRTHNGDSEFAILVWAHCEVRLRRPGPSSNGCSANFLFDCGFDSRYLPPSLISRKRDRPVISETPPFLRPVAALAPALLICSHSAAKPLIQ
jgi:hypothetical protein